MRFRRKAKLFPGVFLNFSKSGISTTIGIPGASVNIGSNGAFLNTGIPGTGIYDRKKIGFSSKDYKLKETQIPKNINYIKSESAETITSEGLEGLKETLSDCYRERTELIEEIKAQRKRNIRANIFLFISYFFIIGFFIKWFKKYTNQNKEELLYLQNQLQNCFVKLDHNIDPKLETTYQNLRSSFEKLTKCEKIWDMTSIVPVDRYATRSAASTSLTRQVVKFSFSGLDIIKSKYDAMFLQNVNGGNIYIYPAFLVIVDDKNFGLVDIREIDFNSKLQKFVEEEDVPSDALIIDRTWAKVNKNGSPDKRFNNNYQIPICLYGQLEMKSTSGLYETYAFSNYEAFNSFASYLDEYKNSCK